MALIKTSCLLIHILCRVELIISPRTYFLLQEVQGTLIYNCVEQVVVWNYLMSLISLYLVPGILHSATVPSTGVQRWLEHYNLSVVNTTELRKKRKGHEWIHSLHGCLLILVFNNYLKQKRIIQSTVIWSMNLIKWTVLTLNWLIEKCIAAVRRRVKIFVGRCFNDASTEPLRAVTRGLVRGQANLHMTRDTWHGGWPGSG